MALGTMTIHVLGVAGLIEAILQVANGQAFWQYSLTGIPVGSDGWDWSTNTIDTVGGFVAVHFFAANNDNAPHLDFISDQHTDTMQDWGAICIDPRTRHTVTYVPDTVLGASSQWANLRTGTQGLIEFITDLLTMFTNPHLAQPWKPFVNPGGSVLPGYNYSDPDTVSGLSSLAWTWFGVACVQSWGADIDITIPSGPAPGTMPWLMIFMWQERQRIADGHYFYDYPTAFDPLEVMLITRGGELPATSIELINAIATKIAQRSNVNHAIRKHKANINVQSTGWLVELIAITGSTENALIRLANAIDADNRRQLTVYVKGKRIVVPGGERS